MLLYQLCKWKRGSTRTGKSKELPKMCRWPVGQQRTESTSYQYTLIATISFLGLVFTQEAVQDLISALKVEAGVVIPAILSLKHEAQGLITQWLLQHGRTALIELVATKDFSKEETLRDLLVIAKALIKICKDAQHHIFYTDVLIANGKFPFFVYLIQLSE